MSKKKFEQFKEECDYWLKELGLTHVEIDYVYGASKGCSAEVMYDNNTMSATICMAKRLKKTIKLNRLALHEVLHIGFWSMLEARDEKEKEVLEHIMINRLINLLTNET